MLFIHTNNNNYQWKRYTTLITYLLIYNSRDVAHISCPHTHTHTHTHIPSCRKWISNMGFISTSTIHIYSTVLYHTTHDNVNLYEHEELPLHSDMTCYKWKIKRHYFHIDLLPSPRNCHSVQVLWSLLARRHLGINISNKWIMNPTSSMVQSQPNLPAHNLTL